MCRQVGMTLLHMHDGFTCKMKKQMTLTSFDDITDVLHM